MTALAADSNLDHRGTVEMQSVPVVETDIIYKGALCMLNADGYLAPCTATASSQFAGIALAQGDNSAGSNGDIEVVCARSGRWLLTISDTITQANVGDVVYAEDDGTVSHTAATNEQKVGVITEFVDGTHCYVEIADGCNNPALGT